MYFPLSTFMCVFSFHHPFVLACCSTYLLFSFNYRLSQQRSFAFYSCVSVATASSSTPSASCTHTCLSCSRSLSHRRRRRLFSLLFSRFHIRSHTTWHTTKRPPHTRLNVTHTAHSHTIDFLYSSTTTELCFTACVCALFFLGFFLFLCMRFACFRFWIWLLTLFFSLSVSLSLCQAAAFACVWVSSSFSPLRYLFIDYLNLTTKLDISTANNKLGLFPFFNVWMNIFLKDFLCFSYYAFFVSSFLACNSPRVCEFRLVLVW